MSRHGHRLHKSGDGGIMLCPESSWRYKEVEIKVLRCLDWPEDEPLPYSGKGRMEEGEGKWKV